MLQIQNYINGRFEPPASGAYLPNYRPRDGQVYSQLPDSDARDVARAVRAAKQAFPAWASLGREERAAYLLRIADALEARLEAFAQAESEDQGKPESLARQVDIPRAVANFRFFAGAILHQSESAHQSSALVLNYTQRMPMGVAGLISPWNLPLYLLTWKIAPALACGNTVVAKPSELTPRTAWMLAELLHEIGLPAGVCNIVHGLGHKAGSALVEDPDVPLISFTGGTLTARAISQAAAPSAKKLSLELGGKNPALIFADADLDAAVAGTLRSSFTNQGEICLCTSRIFVAESLLPRFEMAFLEGAQALTVGDPRQSSTRLGALVSAPHRQKVHGFVEQAVAHGAKLLLGGRPEAPTGDLAEGYYYPPTVLRVDDPSLDIMQEEVFGPVVTLTPFRDAEQAIALANGCRYGLAATLWTRDLSLAHKTAQALEAGLVWINTWMHRDLRVPFGGMKASGVGREGGWRSLEFYTEEKNICLQL